MHASFLNPPALLPRRSCPLHCPFARLSCLSLFFILFLSFDDTFTPTQARLARGSNQVAVSLYYLPTVSSRICISLIDCYSGLTSPTPLLLFHSRRVHSARGTHNLPSLVDFASLFQPQPWPRNFATFFHYRQTILLEHISRRPPIKPKDHRRVAIQSSTADCVCRTLSRQLLSRLLNRHLQF